MDELDPTGEGLVPATGLALAGRGLFGEQGEIDLHQRTRIRRFVSARLKEAAGEHAGRVYTSRVAPIQQAQIPCLVIWTNDENSEKELVAAPRELEREVELFVDIYGAINEDLDEVLDTLARRVEWIVHRDESQGGLAMETKLTSTKVTLAKEGRKVFGLCRLMFKVTYSHPTEEDVLPVLSGMRIRWDMAPPDGQIDAEDELNLQENP